METLIRSRCQTCLRVWVGLARAGGMSGRRVEQGPKLRSPRPSSEELLIETFFIFLPGFGFTPTA